MERLLAVRLTNILLCKIMQQEIWMQEKKLSFFWKMQLKDYAKLSRARVCG